MFSVVTTTKEFPQKKEFQIIPKLEGRDIFLEYEKIGKALINLITDLRQEFLKSICYYELNREQIVNQEKRPLNYPGPTRIYLPNPKDIEPFNIIFRRRLKEFPQLDLCWSLLEYKQYDCSIYPYLFSNSPTSIYENDIDFGKSYSAFLERLMPTNQWIENYYAAEDIVKHNSDNNTVFVIFKEGEKTVLFEMKRNYNRYYSWINGQFVTHSFRSPKNIENIEVHDYEDYLIHEIKVFRINSPIRVLWPKSEGRSKLEDMLYSS